MRAKRPSRHGILPPASRTAGLILWALLALTLFCLRAPLARAAADASTAGAWAPLMDFGAPATHQALLHNGKVLYWRNGNQAAVFDPATGTHKPVPAPFPVPGTNFHCSAQVVLADGRVLAIGGQVDGPHEAINAAAIFDPATEKWALTPPMHYPRWYPWATVLGDGRVAVFGGESTTPDPSSPGTFLRTLPVEIYDPVANTWTVVPGADRDEDLYAPNFLLPDGRIFNAAPYMQTGLLDLTAGKWSPGPSSDWRTIGYSESFVQYRPGVVLRSGGTTTSGGLGTNLAPTNGATKMAEVIDMNQPGAKWQRIGDMAFARRRHNMVLLADGTVLVVGGTAQADDPAQAALTPEIFNPDTRQLRAVAPMTDARMYHSAALLLPDGRVLTAGGEPSTADAPPFGSRAIKPSQSAQIYSPPYLFGPGGQPAARPVITAAPTRVGYNGAFSVATPDAASIASAALIRPSAVTHAANMDQRFVPLSFTRVAGGLNATAPPSGNWAPPGYYMLVVTNTAGVPSLSRWIQVGDGPVLGNPDLPPGDGGNGDGGSGGGGGDGGGGNTGKSGQVLRGTLLVAPNRIRLRTLRRRGVRFTVQINTPLTAAHPVMRIRVSKVLTRTSSRVLTTFYRTPPKRGRFVVTLSSRALRHVRPGRYELTVAVGNSRARLRLPVRRRITVMH
jgi:hypothetical protein